MCLHQHRRTRQADRRSDVYSLGLSLYELLALRPAFDEADRGRSRWRAYKARGLQIVHHPSQPGAEG